MWFIAWKCVQILKAQCQSFLLPIKVDNNENLIRYSTFFFWAPGWDWPCSLLSWKMFIQLKILSFPDWKFQA